MTKHRLEAYATVCFGVGLSKVALGICQAQLFFFFGADVFFFHHFRLVCLVAVVMMVSVFVAQPSTVAQEPAVSKKLLAVDSVKAQDTTYLGLILNDGKQGGQVVIAVDRDWLATTFPKQIEKFEDEEAKYLAPVLDEYDERIDKLIEKLAGKHKEAEQLVELLKLEKERIREKSTAPEIHKKQFILLRFDAADVQTMKPQSYKRKRIAAIAWQNQLKDVPKRTLDDLVEELKTLKVDIENEKIDLSAGLAATKLTEREWSVRKSMFEFKYLGEMEFQGEGDTLFHRSENQDVSKLLTQMMGGSSASQLDKLGRELGLPEFTNQNKPKKDWKSELTKKADKAGFDSILVKRIVDSNNSDQVNVEAVFMAKTADAKWETVKQFKASARLSAQNDNDIDALQQDPRVKSALATLKGMGLANDSLIRTALQKGAATQAALEEVSQKVDWLIENNTFNLDRPLNLN